ncbi:hypothetical protein XH91_12675 [Bradyrhizobium guangzhouense]|uniref:Uncharacterized protein n=1 Tax=Bradyrhizobium guangzhouense TaxID=1325095 RepID=A0AAE6C7Y3_9BRAD|nr:hypothetical protein XH91_12675 [Bradyrhizobium guangzhouense]
MTRLIVTTDSSIAGAIQGAGLADLEEGRSWREKRTSFLRYNPIKRWWGGALLTNERLWRWDARGRSLIAPA